MDRERERLRGPPGLAAKKDSVVDRGKTVTDRERERENPWALAAEEDRVIDRERQGYRTARTHTHTHTHTHTQATHTHSRQGGFQWCAGSIGGTVVNLALTVREMRESVRARRRFRVGAALLRQNKRW